ncbi:MAG: type II secretory pathway pseudopilin PulG [Rickettsiales bacterium]|jgi:type II secretory pathway pseudopilin PulG
MKKMTKKTANTILEFAVVTLIVAGVIAASMSVSKTFISGSEEKITKDRMEVVYSTIKNYVATNKRLPCPALLTVAKGSAGYGNEIGAAGICDGNIISSDNIAHGMIPIDVLNLNRDMAEDGFGTKFSYVVDKRFTKTSAGTSGTDGFELIKSAPAEKDAPDVNLFGIPVVGSGSSLLPNNNGIFVLISHGANKFFGYPAVGITKNSDDDGSDEGINDGTSSFVSSSTQDGFDDIVIFKTKAQLVRDAGLQNIMCNTDEANNNTCPNGTVFDGITRNWGNADSVAESCFLFGDTYCKRTCGQYGVWSSVQSGLKNCGSEVAPDSPPIACSLATGDDYGNQTYTGAPGDFGVDTVIPLTPKSLYCGSPTIRCSNNNGTGEWSGVSGNSTSCYCTVSNGQYFNSAHDIYYGTGGNYPIGHRLTLTQFTGCPVNNSNIRVTCNSHQNWGSPQNPSRGCYNCNSAQNSIQANVLANVDGCSWQQFYSSDYSNGIINLAHGGSASACRYSFRHHTSSCGTTILCHYTSLRFTLSCSDGVVSGGNITSQNNKSCSNYPSATLCTDGTDNRGPGQLVPTR